MRRAPRRWATALMASVSTLCRTPSSAEPPPAPATCFPATGPTASTTRRARRARSFYGNRIGTNAAGTGPVPNGLSGMFVDGNGTTIGGTAAGAANIIAHNGTIGVNVVGGTGHAIVGNSIFANGELGINLGPFAVAVNDAGDGDAGENNGQNYPVLAAAPGGVQGTFNSTPNGTFTIHYYGNTACDPSGNGEGQTFLGGVVGDHRRQRQRDDPAVRSRSRHDRDGDSDEPDQRHVRVLSVRDGARCRRRRRICSLDDDGVGRPGRLRHAVHTSRCSRRTTARRPRRRRRHQHAAASGVTLASAVATQGSCTVQNRTVTCALGRLDGTRRRRSRSTSPARSPVPLHNSAFVTATEVDPVDENNAADVETTITLASCAAPSYSSPVAACRAVVRRHFRRAGGPQRRRLEGPGRVDAGSAAWRSG